MHELTASPVAWCCKGDPRIAPAGISTGHIGPDIDISRSKSVPTRRRAEA